MQRTSIWYSADGDFVVVVALEEGQWRVKTSWLIPGTERHYSGSNFPSYARA